MRWFCMQKMFPLISPSKSLATSGAPELTEKDFWGLGPNPEPHKVSFAAKGASHLPCAVNSSKHCLYILFWYRFNLGSQRVTVGFSFLLKIIKSIKLIVFTEHPSLIQNARQGGHTDRTESRLRHGGTRAGENAKDLGARAVEDQPLGAVRPARGQQSCHAQLAALRPVDFHQR